MLIFGSTITPLQVFGKFNDQEVTPQNTNTYGRLFHRPVRSRYIQDVRKQMSICESIFFFSGHRDNHAPYFLPFGPCLHSAVDFILSAVHIVAHHIDWYHMSYVIL